MQYAFSNCEFTKINLDKYPNHDYLIEGVWLGTNEEHKVTVKAPDLYKYHQGELIQDCFPYLSRKDREFLITGTWLEPPKHEDEESFDGINPQSDIEYENIDLYNADKAKDNKDEQK